MNLCFPYLKKYINASDIHETTNAENITEEFISVIDFSIFNKIFSVQRIIRNGQVYYIPRCKELSYTELLAVRLVGN